MTASVVVGYETYQYLFHASNTRMVIIVRWYVVAMTTAVVYCRKYAYVPCPTQLPIHGQ